jgi:preprotein translocase subunit SecA
LATKTGLDFTGKRLAGTLYAMKLNEWFKVKGRHEKAALALWPQVKEISALASEMEKLSDEELKNRVIQYRGKDLKELKKNTNEIFAAIREASNRTLKMRHFDVQIMGGLLLLDGTIAEMKTGEGKTLVATLPLIAHALTGKGAHLVTVNDYLGQRDAEWMRPVYEFFDLSLGVVMPGMQSAEKRTAYAADITYGTNNEFGFDYLRDNMAPNPESMVQRPLNYAIVDEVDSILIDEARTPLIISAPDTESTQSYQQFAQLVPGLKEGSDYNVDEKRKAAVLTDEGISRVEGMLGIDNIYEERGIRMVHHLEQALRAHALYHRDKDYVVKDGQVIIVDEFTGRLMEGRRYSEGLHQAIEAKEGVAVQQESRTLATITFQNYFRLYDYLAGMTGTAVTSAEEFEKVYNLDVAVIPTNKPLARKDLPDKIFATEKAKFMACAREIKLRQEKGQPVLVGTVAIEKSEYLSQLLQREGVTHEVLNAKHHEREAEIVAKAGQRGAVTISTNMAGRGTDIKLGEDVANLGGLLVMGTERHEARRIDNQLRGRSGRQGDPGETRFFVSLEDDVMRIFGGERLKGIMQRLKVPEDQPIESQMVSKALESAQERVEGYYFDMRKQVLSYDNVLNKQRNAIYTLRKGIMLKGQWRESGSQPVDLIEYVPMLMREQARGLVTVHTGEKLPTEWNSEEIVESLQALAGGEIANLRERLAAGIGLAQKSGPEAGREELEKNATDILLEALSRKEQELGQETLKELEKAAALRSIDMHWMDHLDTMDYLRTGIGLRGYGQRDPLVEYQKEGYQLFVRLLDTIKFSLVETVLKAQAVRQETQTGEAHHQSATAPHRIGQDIEPRKQTVVNKYKGVGRNDLCPCGSGKKFKKCHGKS